MKNDNKAAIEENLRAEQREMLCYPLCKALKTQLKPQRLQCCEHPMMDITIDTYGKSRKELVEAAFDDEAIVYSFFVCDQFIELEYPRARVGKHEEVEIVSNAIIKARTKENIDGFVRFIKHNLKKTRATLQLKEKHLFARGVQNLAGVNSKN